MYIYNSGIYEYGKACVKRAPICKELYLLHVIFLKFVILFAPVFREI